MLKILQARLQQYVNHELPDVQVGFRKGRGTRDQIANIHWIMEKARRSRKTCISALLTMTNLDSILKSRDITLSTKVRLVKAMVFPGVMYGYEIWTIKKAEG